MPTFKKVKRMMKDSRALSLSNSACEVHRRILASFLLLEMSSAPTADAVSKRLRVVVVFACAGVECCGIGPARIQARLDSGANRWRTSRTTTRAAANIRPP